MADVQPSGLTQKTTVAASDIYVVQDGSTGVVQYVQASKMLPPGGVLPVNLFGGLGSSWVWQTWSPTLSNMTLGNGTITAKYTQIGKTVHYRFVFVLGSTSAMGPVPTFTLPSTPAAWGQSGTASMIIGLTWVEDTGVGSYHGVTSYSTGSTASPLITNTSGTYAVANAISATVPMTWGIGDTLTSHGCYEPA